MLRDQKRGKIDSWAIRWVYQQFKNKQFTVYPRISKVQNIGICDHGTHTKRGKRFKTILDGGFQMKFLFEINGSTPKLVEYIFYSNLKHKWINLQKGVLG